MVEEKLLIEKLLTGDKQAAKILYFQYYPRLTNYVKNRINNPKDAEEIVQDTLYAFLESARDFTGKSSINTYICAIANHKIVDFYRKKKLKKILFSQLPAGFENLLIELSTPEKNLDEILLSQKINWIFKKLTPVYAKLLQLKYIEDRSVEEIAKIFDFSFKATESMLFRARKAFVKLYSV